MRPFVLALLLLARPIDSLAQPARGADGAGATQFGLDARHTGRSDARGPRRAPHVVWRVRARHRVFATPVLSEGELIVFAGVDGMVHALDRDGVERWAFSAPNEVFATPAARGGMVFAGHDGPSGHANGALVALDARGRARWSYTTAEDLDAPPTLGPDGTLYVLTRGIVALDASGAPRWTAPTNEHGFAAPALSPDGAVLYAADLSGQLAFVHTSDGRVERRVAVGAPVYAAPLVLDDGTVVVGARDGHVRAFAPDGTPRWDFVTRDEVHAAPALARDGTVIVGSDDGVIYGIHAADGTEAFRAQTNGRVRAQARVDADGWVYVGSEDNMLYALDPHGTVAWSVNMGSDVDDAVLLLPWGGLAVGCDDAALYYLQDG